MKIEKAASGKRYSLSDNFEEIYLRERTLKRFIANGDLKLIAEKETAKVIEHLTDRQMAVYGKILSWNGFDREDIRSIVMTFCLCFTGIEKLANAKSKKDYYYLMMNFVNQRMEYFISCVMRKFQISDVVNYNVAGTHAVGSSQEEFIGMVAEEHREPGPAEEESEMTLPENISYLEDQLEVIKLRFTEAEEAGKKDQAVQLKDAIGRMMTVIQSYREEHNESVQADRALSADLKKRLADNPKAHSEKLCYYATYKGIPYDVRRAARNVCRRHGIDYISWAKSRVGQPGSNEEAHFDLR